MRKRQIMQTAVERIAYEKGYQDGAESMFDYWCLLKSQNAQYRAEIQRLKEVLEEEVYG